MIKIEKKPAKITLTMEDVFSAKERTAFLHLIADGLLDERNERIKRGKTTDGRNLLTGKGAYGTVARYTKAYEKKKAKDGHAVYDKYDRLVDTGEMMRGQTVTSKGDTAYIIFAPVDVGKAISNDLRRPFISFSSKEIESVVNDIIAEVRKGRVKKAGK